VKRSVLILLTAIYLLSGVGIGINRFYCCGRLASVTVIYGAPDNTPNVVAAKKYKCCRNEKKNFKVNDSHYNAVSGLLSNPMPAIIPTLISLDNEALVNTPRTKIIYNGNAPPGHSAIPVYTLHCSYRI